MHSLCSRILILIVAVACAILASPLLVRAQTAASQSEVAPRGNPVNKRPLKDWLRKVKAAGIGELITDLVEAACISDAPDESTRVLD